MIKIKKEKIKIKNINKLKEGDYVDLPYCMVGNKITSSTIPNINNNGKAYIDYRDIEKGFIKVKYLYLTTTKLKVQVKGKSIYTYDIKSDIEYVLPLSEGDGKYEVIVYENVTGNKYKKIITQSLDVIIKEPFYAYKISNIYVNYKNGDAVFNKARTLVDNKKTDIDKINSIYTWVVNNFTYDTKLAKTVKSAYIPNLVNVLNKKSGICFDYAALTVAMLRIVGIPAKLVFGYAGNSYHAWIEVYSKVSGKINKNFDIKANSWTRLDPTFDSSGKSSSSVIKYIGDGKNYSSKYFY